MNKSLILVTFGIVAFSTAYSQHCISALQEIEWVILSQRMQRIADAAFETAANHAVNVFGMADSRLDGLAALQQLPLSLAHRLDAPRWTMSTSGLSLTL